MTSNSWNMTDTHPFVEATISGRRTRVYHNSIIEPFGEPSSGEILTIPPADCPNPMPTATARDGKFKAVPARILPRANK